MSDPSRKRLPLRWLSLAEIVGVGALVADTPELPFSLGAIYGQLTEGDPRTCLPAVLASRRKAGRPLSPGDPQRWMYWGRFAKNKRLDAPAPPAAAAEPASFLLLEEQAASSAEAAVAALTMPAPLRSRRRVAPWRPSVSTASSTLGWTFVITNLRQQVGVGTRAAPNSGHASPRPPPIRAVVRYFEWRSKYLPRR